ncbi:GntR family transcriptional regulator [Hydrogenophaga defluvii]|uniref:GntR family transcriptional regulator n=1 Tax=Hydrogenophaga defluvii TaxID=249410 RepID=A0ABW2S9P3_9BURK
MAISSPTTAPLSLHEDVAVRLRELIYSGELPPGAFVDEPALCERLAISRTPLREALKVLTAEGLMRHEPRRGCFVNQVTERDLDEIFPVIALLEGRCAFEAASRVNDADLRVLDGMHQRLRDCAAAGQIAAYYEANHVIHEAIIQLADNRWLAQVIADLRKILRLSRQQSLQVPGRLEQSLSEHMAVFAALQARDNSGAEAAMRTHLLRQREALRELSRQQPRSLMP